MKTIIIHSIVTISRYLFLLSIKFKFYFLSFIVLSLNSRIYGNKNSQVRLLCISKSIFHDDIKALGKYGNQICYVYTPSYFFRDLFSYCFPNEEVNHENYHSISGYEKNKETYREMVGELLRLFVKYKNICCIIAANFTYAYLQELFNAAKKLNILSVVLYKEGLAPREMLDEFVKLYKPYNNLADYVIFYNEPNREAMIKLPVGGITHTNTVALGIPRFDSYHHTKYQENNLVVLFSFYPEDKAVGMFSDDKKKEIFFRRVDEFHKYAMEFAYNNPKYHVLIKTKQAPKYLDYVNSIRNKYFFDKKVNNLQITSNGVSFDYIVNAKVVLGYNSTTLIEAIVANKPVILPYLKDIIVNKPSDYFSKYPDFPLYAKNYQEIEKHIVNIKHHKYNEKEKEELLTGMIYKNDGLSCKRVEDFIIKKISQQ